MMVYDILSTMMNAERSGDGPKIRKLRGFFFDPEGNLRRGVPVIVEDAEGNEIPAYREHNTRIVFPRTPREGEKTRDDSSA